MIFRNKNFVKRSGDCTNVVACEVEGFAKPSFGWNGQPADYWVADPELDLKKLQFLGSIAGVKFYGYL